MSMEHASRLRARWTVPVEGVRHERVRAINCNRVGASDTSLTESCPQARTEYVPVYTVRLTYKTLVSLLHKE